MIIEIHLKKNLHVRILTKKQKRKEKKNGEKQPQQQQIEATTHCHAFVLYERLVE